ncbi:MAG: phosphodiester glycosidase family protein [Bacteroidales bacterium]|nr:phosphodiester glycosidase family protein [Bacteroidales bacterium]
MKTRALLLPLLLLLSCGKPSDKSSDVQPVAAKWVRQTVAEGLVWHNYEGFDSLTAAMQIVNVLEVDLSRGDLHLSYAYYPDKEILSRVAKERGVIAATNASFGVPHTYIRIDGVNICEIDTQPGETNWWKHETAVGFDGNHSFGFYNYDGRPSEAVPVYHNSTWRNLYSSTPILIDDYSLPEWDLKTDSSAGKNYGGKRLLVLNRHPRTALATMEDGRLLLITVDGRWEGKAAGMTCEELRQFLIRHFHPQFAVNMDGGGSTTMFVKGFGAPDTGIVNYPCDGTGDTGQGYRFDHSHERAVPTFFLITRNVQ